MESRTPSLDLMTGVLVLAAAARAQVSLPGANVAVPGTTATAPVVFTPLRAMPLYNPPPASTAPDNEYFHPRVSGVWGFTDSGPLGAFSYPREMVLAGRGDGLFLLDATPPEPGPAVADVSGLAGNSASFLPDNRYQPYPTPPFNTGLPFPQVPYTPWKECAVLYHAASDTYTAYAVDGDGNGHPRPGLWIVPLTRNPTTQVLQLPSPSTPQIFWDAASIDSGHNMTIDQATGLIFVVTNNPAVGGGQRLLVYSTTPPASPTTPALVWSHYGTLSPQEMPHDAYLKNGKLYVSLWGGYTHWAPPLAIGAVEEFQIADFLTAPGPTQPLRRMFLNVANGGLPMGTTSFAHSVYIDAPFMWIMQEQQGWPIGWRGSGNRSGRVNMQPVDMSRDLLTGGPAPTTGSPVEFAPLLATGHPTPSNLAPRTVSEDLYGSLFGLIAIPGAPLPTSEFPVTGFPMSCLAHQLRGLGRTAFVAHYVDGIDLVDLSTPGAGLTMLGSFDTTYDHQLTNWLPSQPPSFTEPRANTHYVFRGVYDVWPYQDSGLVYAAAGLEGLIVFRIDRGQMNRYWRPSPFGISGTASPSVYPSIVAPYGPPRTGRQLILRDGNKSRLNGVNAGNPVSYRYQLLTATTPPLNPVAGAGFTYNIDPAGPIYKYGPQEDDAFTLAPSQLPSVDLPLFAQMTVEELRKNPAPTSDADLLIPYSPPKIAASRGTWFGMAP